MVLTGRRALTALALGLLLPLAACTEDEPASSSATQPGDQVGVRTTGLEAGTKASVVTPAGRLTVAFADPVDRIGEEQATDRVEREAPEGAVFVPVLWSFEEDVFGELTRLFGDRQALEVELVSGDERYTLTPPVDGSGRSAEYVAVTGDGGDLSLEVTYDEVTQTLDAETGKVDKGVAARLYDMTKTRIRIKDCPIKEWFDDPLVYQQYECQYTNAVATPYVVNEWAKPGHSWLAVTMLTNLALYATGDLGGSIASYDVVGNKELSTVNGKRALGTLRERVNEGAASGTLVFDVKGRLPKTLQVMREYRLKLNGAVGKVDAPERRKVRIGGPIELIY